MKIKMYYKKATKNTYVYEDKSKSAVIPSLYLRKGSLPEVAPEEILIEISWGKNNEC